MSFAFPLALIGLLAVPALIAVYLLRSKHRRLVVSSLMLWIDEGNPRAGGRVWDRLQTPLLFLLELLAILLLILAAAGPVISARAAGTLVVVLDDSFSMLAGTAESARSRAAAAMRDELERGDYQAIKAVVAGETPSLLGEATGAAQATALLDRWKCPAPSANLDEAGSFAFTLAGSRGRVLILTDHAPSEAPSNDRLRWLAFGDDQANVAFVNATRTDRGGSDRCLLEVANLSRYPVTRRVVVEDIGGSQPREIKSYDLDLGPQESSRIIFNLDAGAGPLRARLPADALAIDNEVLLLPDRQKHVRVATRFNSDKLKDLVEKAVLATGIAQLNEPNPQLLFTESAQFDDAAAEMWTVQMIDEPDAQSYIGPFVINREHALAEGLSLNGIVWAGGRAEMAGRPVISAGDVPLVTDLQRGDRHDLRWRLRPEVSTLQDTPAWPVLIWNLLNWRASEAPGVGQSNVRLGSSSTVKLAADAESVVIRSPGGETRDVRAADRSISVKAETAGIYELTAGNAMYRFASNALSQGESDLTRSASGGWGGWHEATADEIQQRGIAWIFLLMALIVLATHLALAARLRRGSGKAVTRLERTPVASL